jgi:hypothetical protein
MGRDMGERRGEGLKKIRRKIGPFRDKSRESTAVLAGVFMIDVPRSGILLTSDGDKGPELSSSDLL